MNRLNQEQITDAIITYATVHGLGKNKEYKKLHSLVCNASKQDRYFGLMGVFLRDLKAERLRVQTLAGRMLLKITPKAMERCEEAVFRLLANWDVSAEEVILYLQSQFGDESLLSAIVEMESTAQDENDVARLKIMKYWLGISAHSEEEE
ncbi:hypothetical protein [Alteromonas stellipolaris]|uniref:hypothetical protein n=1 Tax=Alteromonas stellipolaris TaxID=233316 RepID=UPI002732362A|nr:hypothetical protein [Alteromonas stellipolaris]MDP2596397.1 hypothetical protein [Alteromonas stellipolaris]